MKRILLFVICLLIIPSIVGSSIDTYYGVMPDLIIEDDRQSKVLLTSNGIKCIFPLKKKKIIINEIVLEEGWKKYTVLVETSFYNPDDPKQTDDTPGLCAWLHQFQLGDRIIAVSQDFVKNKILDNGDIVEVEGLGSFTVRDKMNERYTFTIDVAISDPSLTFKQRKAKALKLGRKKLKISWLRRT
ncbi:hypothetical protein KAR91_21925 [Candidatus Pacearchaeota archaeon]|nr:hypothetical protein [Candidatus Pacearchaeota archaeon]